MKCKYCEADTPHEAESIFVLPLGEILGRKVTAECYIFGNALSIEIEEELEKGKTGTDERIVINFCPFCGRKL